MAGATVSYIKDCSSHLKIPKVFKLNQKETVGLGGMSVEYWYSRFPSEISRQHPMPTSAREKSFDPLPAAVIPHSMLTGPRVLPEHTSNLTPYPAYFLMKPGKLRGHPVPLLVLFVQK